MDPHEEFILFLEKNPAYYVIMKSQLYIEVLEKLARKPLSRPALKNRFPEVETSDLDLIVESLVEIGLVSRFRAGENFVYYSNDKGKLFLEKYAKTKRHFLGKEQKNPK
jgi:hypothetical protein